MVVQVDFHIDVSATLSFVISRPTKYGVGCIAKS